MQPFLVSKDLGRNVNQRESCKLMSFLVPLEDGDRCEALVAMGKTVIVVDLNPLSRSSQRGSITIVDELSRCLENMLTMETETLPSLDSYDHNKTLQDALNVIVDGMKNKFSEAKE